jgi:hypothetical protein
MLCKYFLPFLGCLFFLLSVWWAEAFQFDVILICLFLPLFPVFCSAFQKNPCAFQYPVFSC